MTNPTTLRRLRGRRATLVGTLAASVALTLTLAVSDTAAQAVTPAVTPAAADASPAAAAAAQSPARTTQAASRSTVRAAVPVYTTVKRTSTVTRATKLQPGSKVRVVARSWKKNHVVTAPATVGRLLDAQKVRIDGNDIKRLSAPSGADRAAGVVGTLTVQKVTVSTRTTSKRVGYRTIVKKSSHRYRVLGATVQRAGKKGTKTTRTRVTVVDGKVVARKVVKVTNTSRAKIVVKGTKKTPRHHTVAFAKAVARDKVAKKGWSTRQYQCLVSLWNRESGWRVSATNRSSGAAGIPQALPGRKMASAGPSWRTNAITQVTWGLGYIKGRYGTPCGALAHSHRTGWY